MANKQGTKYPEEFKQQIVDLYHEGTPVTKLTSEYGIIEQTIYKQINISYSNQLPAYCIKY